MWTCPKVTSCEIKTWQFFDLCDSHPEPSVACRFRIWEAPKWFQKIVFFIFSPLELWTRKLISTFGLLPRLHPCSPSCSSPSLFLALLLPLLVGSPPWVSSLLSFLLSSQHFGKWSLWAWMLWFGYCFPSLPFATLSKTEASGLGSWDLAFAVQAFLQNWTWILGACFSFSSILSKSFRKMELLGLDPGIWLWLFKLPFQKLSKMKLLGLDPGI